MICLFQLFLTHGSELIIIECVKKNYEFMLTMFIYVIIYKHKVISKYLLTLNNIDYGSIHYLLQYNTRDKYVSKYEWNNILNSLIVSARPMNKIIGTTHIRPWAILLQFKTYSVYIEKVKLMKIYYNNLFKCPLIVSDIVECLYYSHNSPCYQINTLAKNNILFKHNYLCHYFLIKFVYLSMYAYWSYYYAFLFEKAPEIYLELIPHVINVKCITRFVYIPHCMSHGLAHCIAQVYFLGHRTMTHAVNNNIIVPISHRMSAIIIQTFPNIPPQSVVPNNRFQYVRSMLFWFLIRDCRRSTPRFILLLHCLCTQTSVFTSCQICILLFIIYVIVGCMLPMCAIFSSMYLGHGIEEDLYFSMSLKRGCSLSLIRNLITWKYKHKNSYSINVNYNNRCMPLYIRKQCYSRRYILLCTLICGVYTIDCTLSLLCAYILYTLHIIVLIAKYNPCNIGQLHERPNCERKFLLIYLYMTNICQNTFLYITYYYAKKTYEGLSFSLIKLFEKLYDKGKVEPVRNPGNLLIIYYLYVYYNYRYLRTGKVFIVYVGVCIKYTCVCTICVCVDVCACVIVVHSIIKILIKIVIYLFKDIGLWYQNTTLRDLIELRSNDQISHSFFNLCSSENSKLIYFT